MCLHQLYNFGRIYRKLWDVFAICRTSNCEAQLALIHASKTWLEAWYYNLPLRKVKVLPGSIPLTTPLNCAPAGELKVTNMVSPMNWFDMLDSVLGRALLLGDKALRWAVIREVERSANMKVLTQWIVRYRPDRNRMLNKRTDNRWGKRDSVLFASDK